MKKLIYLLFISMTLILCYSCSKKQDDITEPDYDVFREMDNDSSDNDKADTSTMAEITPGIGGDLDINADPTDEPVITPSMTETNELIKEWPYTLEFEGAGTEFEVLPSGNLDANIKQTYKTSCLICPDEQNDCLYYINYNKDFYIYRLQDGVSTLLVDKRALYLQLWNNELYFIMNDKMDDIKIDYGDIYCFNLSTKELRLIVKANVSSFSVNSDGIFYRAYTTEREILTQNMQSYGYKLGFDSSTPKKADYFVYFPFENYEIYNLDGNFVLSNNATGEKTIIAPLDYYYQMEIRVFGEYFTFKKEGFIYLLNLKTGEKKVYDFNSCPGFPNISIWDYIIVNNKIYATVKNITNIIISYDLNNGEITALKSPKIQLSLNELYAYNNRIFSLTASAKPELVELDLSGGGITVKEW